MGGLGGAAERLELQRRPDSAFMGGAGGSAGARNSRGGQDPALCCVLFACLCVFVSLLTLLPLLRRWRQESAGGGGS